MSYKVTSLAWDPGSGTLFYTNNNKDFFSLRDLMAVDVRTGEERTLIKHGRIGEIVFNPVDKSLMGVRHADGIATLVRVPAPYDGYDEVYTFPYGVVPYDLDISPDGRLLSASVAEVNGDQFLRVWELEKVLDGDLKPLSEFRFGQSVPESFVFPRMDATCTAAAITRGCPTSSGTKSRRVRSRRSPTRKSDSSGRCRSPTVGSSS